MLVVGMSNTHYNTVCSDRDLNQAALEQQLQVFSTLMLAVGMSNTHCTWHSVVTLTRSLRPTPVFCLASRCTLERHSFHTVESSSSSSAITFLFFSACVTRFFLGAGGRAHFGGW